MGLLESVLKRLPLSPAIFYLPVGYALGPAGLNLIAVDYAHHAPALTVIIEITLLISLFTVGLKLRLPLTDRMWWLPLRLGVLAMLATIGMLTAVGMYVLKLPLGGAVLLAAILAPTDPILASDVQIQNAGDRDRIRFSLSGEGGLNDGTTYPFVMLGLALLAVPQAQAYAGGAGVLKVLWGVAAGLGCGWLMGRSLGHLVVYLRHRYKSALGMEEFLTLGLIAVSYGVAAMVQGIGFVAVFATGVAVREFERQSSGERPPNDVIGRVAAGEEEQIATDPKKASAYMTEMVLGFNQQLEHIAEFAMVLLLGVLASHSGFSLEGVLVALLLFLIVRPVAVALSLIGTQRQALQTGMMAWFGIRGIGSLYYLMFALQYDWMQQQSERFVSLVVTVISMSIFMHGVSATPLMDWYYRRTRRKTP